MAPMTSPLTAERLAELREAAEADSGTGTHYRGVLALLADRGRLEARNRELVKQRDTAITAHVNSRATWRAAEARAQAAEARIAALTNWAARALRFIDHDDIAGAELENDRGSSAELVESGYAALGLEMDDDAALAALAARDGGGG